MIHNNLNDLHHLDYYEIENSLEMQVHLQRIRFCYTLIFNLSFQLFRRPECPTITIN